MSRKSKRDLIIEANMPVVKRLARQLAPKFPFAAIEDLEGAGYVGLVEAANRVAPKQRSKANAFVWFRIHGAIIDANKRKQFQESQHRSLEDNLAFSAATLANSMKSSGSFGQGRDPVDARVLPDQLAEQAELRRTVELLVSELPVDVAKLMRRVMSGLSVSAAARSLGMSPAWGRARLAEARDRIGAGVILR